MPRSMRAPLLPCPSTADDTTGAKRIQAGGWQQTAGPCTTSRAFAEGERKVVTALFADIKGSTELMEDPDPEEIHAII